MAVDLTWPITVASLRDALGFESTQGSTSDLELYALAACERIDTHTGRDVDPTRHLRMNGKLPVIFILAARETGKLWFQQNRNGPRAQPSQLGDQIVGPPMGADLPRKVEGWLAPYPAPPGIA